MDLDFWDCIDRINLYYKQINMVYRYLFLTENKFSFLECVFIEGYRKVVNLKFVSDRGQPRKLKKNSSNKIYVCTVS